MNNQPSQGPLGLAERERELEEIAMRERERHSRMQEENAQREREYHERHAREQQVREQQSRDQHQAQPQHQNNTSAIPLHQPVASRIPGAIHSPGGLLAAHGGGGGGPNPLGAPAGPGNAFGAPLLGEANRSLQHQQHAGPVSTQQHQPFGSTSQGQAIMNHAGSQQQAAQMGGPIFGASLNGAEAAARLQQMPFSNGMGGQMPNGAQQQQQQQLGQGQQPILNDALSYLDQVKVQFSEQPDVYNRFLDIMKDFKSQAIDTPGVINRVSELFAGHPNLIQGFNTFLPPGYRIECGAGNDPNSIRVTTPMGTTVQSITGRANLQESGPGATNSFNYPQRTGPSAAGWDQRPATSIESPEAAHNGFSPQGRVGQSSYTQNQAQELVPTYESQQAAAAAHRQQQQGVHHLQNAVATATGQAPPRHVLTPTPGQANGAQQPGMEKRGPVEFNHAISYVNKIKNRFQDKPEIYKQFLEILQTYQRESKPIQDVYAQVTTLFSDATDLLEDFKQFLPESAAQAKQAAAKAAEENREAAALAMSGAMAGAMSGVVPDSRPDTRPDVKLPAVGTFLPPGNKVEGTGVQTKKRSRNGPSTVPSHAGMGDSNRASIGGGNGNKRAKTSHNLTQDVANSAIDVEPTLMPRLADPMPPASRSASDQRDIAFFDKVKKYLSNKQSFAEFLKLCNLFTMDLIDKNVLVHRIGFFIGQNSELMEAFKVMVKWSPGEEVIENKPAEMSNSGRVSLSNCRGLGPSYRLLPRREKLKPCSGRDEMCNAVLNDEWASHPTWASEDSGFVAHRKNVYEESLHRIEEERHDYDFNIEANAKVIQLLEPIGQQICGMTKDQLSQFRMPLALGGQSQSIYKRILKKIYGPIDGQRVCEDLFNDPIAVLPIVLARLKQKDEEWRFTQREWEKIWHAQTQSMYLKSLDHLGIHIKATDKKMFSAKFIVENMKSVHEGIRRQRSLQGTVQQGQIIYDFSDQEVVLDAIRFTVLYVTAGSQHSASETDRIATFVKEVIPLFFGIPDAAVQERVKDIAIESADDEIDEPAPAELTNGRGRRMNGKKDLRRGVLDKPKNGDLNRAFHEDSAASGSKESTPDVGSGLEDGDEMLDAPEDRSTPDTTNDRWTSNNPTPAAVAGRPLSAMEASAKLSDHYRRDYYNMYCNQTLFVFFTLFQMLYRRLKDIKECEADVADEIRRNKAWKPAKDLGLIAPKPDVFVNDGTTFYSQTLGTIESYIEGNLEESSYVDILRHYYLKKGWALYTVSELLKAICRAAGTCSGNDAKDKTPEIVAKFRQDRTNDAPSYNADINYRLGVQKLIKDSELFMVRYTPYDRKAKCSIKTKDHHTIDLAPEDRIERWKYYMSSYVRVEPTEGISRNTMQKVVHKRNLPKDSDIESIVSSGMGGRKDAKGHEDLILRICVNSYKMLYQKNTEDLFVTPQAFTKNDTTITSQRRNDAFKDRFERNNVWMKGMSQSQVQGVNDEFKTWMENGNLPPQRAATSPQ